MFPPGFLLKKQAAQTSHYSQVGMPIPVPAPFPVPVSMPMIPMQSTAYMPAAPTASHASYVTSDIFHATIRKNEEIKQELSSAKLSLKYSQHRYKRLLSMYKQKKAYLARLKAEVQQIQTSYDELKCTGQSIELMEEELYFKQQDLIATQTALTDTQTTLENTRADLSSTEEKYFSKIQELESNIVDYQDKLQETQANTAKIKQQAEQEKIAADVTCAMLHKEMQELLEHHRSIKNQYILENNQLEKAKLEAESLLDAISENYSDLQMKSDQTSKELTNQVAQLQGQVAELKQEKLELQSSFDQQNSNLKLMFIEQLATSLMLILKKNIDAIMSIIELQDFSHEDDGYSSHLAAETDAFCSKNQLNLEKYIQIAKANFNVALDNIKEISSTKNLKENIQNTINCCYLVTDYFRVLRDIPAIFAAQLNFCVLINQYLRHDHNLTNPIGDEKCVMILICLRSQCLDLEKVLINLQKEKHLLNESEMLAIVAHHASANRSLDETANYYKDLKISAKKTTFEPIQFQAFINCYDDNKQQNETLTSQSVNAAKEALGDDSSREAYLSWLNILLQRDAFVQDYSAEFSSQYQRVPSGIMLDMRIIEMLSALSYQFAKQSIEHFSEKYIATITKFLWQFIHNSQYVEQEYNIFEHMINQITKYAAGVADYQYANKNIAKQLDQELRCFIYSDKKNYIRGIEAYRDCCNILSKYIAYCLENNQKKSCANSLKNLIKLSNCQDLIQLQQFLKICSLVFNPHLYFGSTPSMIKNAKGLFKKTMMSYKEQNDNLLPKLNFLGSPKLFGIPAMMFADSEIVRLELAKATPVLEETPMRGAKFSNTKSTMKV